MACFVRSFVRLALLLLCIRPESHQHRWWTHREREREVDRDCRPAQRIEYRETEPTTATNRRTVTPPIHPNQHSGFMHSRSDWRGCASGGLMCLCLGVLESTLSLPSSNKREGEEGTTPWLRSVSSLLYPRRPFSAANTTPPLCIRLGMLLACRPNPFTAKPSLRTIHGKLRTHLTHSKRFAFVRLLTPSFIPFHKSENRIIDRSTNYALTQNKKRLTLTVPKASAPTTRRNDSNHSDCLHSRNHKKQHLS